MNAVPKWRIGRAPSALSQLFSGESRLAVSVHRDGSFVVVWASKHEGDAAVLAQRFDSAGERLGTELAVSASDAAQSQPAVESLRQGRFVIVWEAHDAGASTYEVVGRRFDADGTPLGTELTAGSPQTGPKRRPAVSADPSGRFVVCALPPERCRCRPATLSPACGSRRRPRARRSTAPAERHFRAHPRRAARMRARGRERARLSAAQSVCAFDAARSDVSGKS